MGAKRPKSLVLYILCLSGCLFVCIQQMTKRLNRLSPKFWGNSIIGRFMDDPNFKKKLLINFHFSKSPRKKKKRLNNNNKKFKSKMGAKIFLSLCFFSIRGIKVPTKIEFYHQNTSAHAFWNADFCIFYL